MPIPIVWKAVRTVTWMVADQLWKPRPGGRTGSAGVKRQSVSASEEEVLRSDILPLPLRKLGSALPF